MKYAIAVHLAFFATDYFHIMTMFNTVNPILIHFFLTKCLIVHQSSSVKPRKTGHEPMKSDVMQFLFVLRFYGPVNTN